MQARAAKPSPVAIKPLTLEERYEAAFGKKPHHRLKLSTIQKRLEAHDAGNHGA